MAFGCLEREAPIELGIHTIPDLGPQTPISTVLIHESTVVH